jgi:hypothetical protein
VQRGALAKMTFNLRLGTALAIISLIALTGCGSPRHQILGTTYGWDADVMKVEVLLDAQIGKLRVRHVRKRNSLCTGGFIGGRAEHLEISGEIGPDSTAALERLLPKLEPCVLKDGSRSSSVVYLSSGGGLLRDGYRLGELFRKYQITTVITGGQVCASSCAIAFLGGLHRAMYHDAKLLFHAPFLKSGIAIDCTDRGQVADLKMYYQRVLGDQNGAFLLNRTMSYCDAASGWTLNADGAKLFGITTN